MEKCSKEIVKLCDDSFLAQTRRSCGKQHCKPRSKNTVTVLRRELKIVYGILLKMMRNGRKRIKTYKLHMPTALIDLATSSSFFSSQSCHQSSVYFTRIILANSPQARLHRNRVINPTKFRRTQNTPWKTRIKFISQKEFPINT